VETTSPTCSLSAIRESEAQSKCFTALQHTRSPTVDGSHRIVVFPALSNPNTKILASFSPKRASNFDIHSPMPSCREPQITCALSQSDRCLAYSINVLFTHCKAFNYSQFSVAWLYKNIFLYQLSGACAPHKCCTVSKHTNTSDS